MLHMMVRLPRDGEATARMAIRADVQVKGLLWNTKAHDRKEGRDQRVFPVRVG